MSERMKEHGTRKYLLKVPHYREGVMHPIGTVIEVDADEKPSPTWKLVAKNDPRPSVRLPPLPKPRKPDEPPEPDSEEAAILASYGMSATPAKHEPKHEPPKK